MNLNRHTVSWQGWQLVIPHRWDPVKLEGDHANGYALFADALRPRLGLRWQTPRRRKFDADLAVQVAMKNEVGQLAAEEARVFGNLGNDWESALIYLEPQPPGRDVFSVYSPVSNRLLQIAYHANRRENILARTLLPTLTDLPTEYAHAWSIFDLNCVIPGGMKLTAQSLSVGDLSLTFADRYTQLTIRQIAVAQLALQRQPLDRWIADEQNRDARHYRPTSKFEEISVPIADHAVAGRFSTSFRKRRYALLWNLPGTQTTMALHDQNRDRLLLLRGFDSSLLRVVAESIGTVSGGGLA